MEKQDLELAARKLGIGGYERHVFLCTGPDCCSPEAGQEAWLALKDELKKRGLTAPQGTCYRSKVGCLRICMAGPTMVVYPEGTWYAGMTAERMPRFVQEHLVENRPVQEWIFARNPLNGPAEEQP